MVIGGPDSTVVVIKVQVQDTDIIKEVVVHGARGAPPMDGAWGSDGIRYCVHINMCYVPGPVLQLQCYMCHQSPPIPMGNMIYFTC